MKYFIIGDIHSCFDELVELLCDVPSDAIIISLGDVLDKGPVENSSKCLELLAANNVILCASNHDEKYVEFIKKNRKSESIKNEQRRRVYESLSKKAKEYLISRTPYYRTDDFICVHGGIGPLHQIDGSLDAETFNDIIRLRYVEKSSLKKVSTIHNPDGSYGPEIPIEQVFKWQEIYSNRRYGCVFHGHIVENLEYPIYWSMGKPYGIHDAILEDLPDVISLDCGAVYGGHLCGALVEDKVVNFEQVKAEQAYCE